jgi:hypothetical protein
MLTCHDDLEIAVAVAIAVAAIAVAIAIAVAVVAATTPSPPRRCVSSSSLEKNQPRLVVHRRSWQILANHPVTNLVANGTIVPNLDWISWNVACWKQQ